MKNFNFNGNRIVNWLLLITFSTAVLATFAAILPESILYLISIVALLFINNKVLLNKTTSWFLLFQAVFLFDCFGGNGIMPFNNALKISMIMLAVIMTANYYISVSLNNWTKVAKILLLLVMVSGTSTFIINFFSPNALRTIMAAGVNENIIIQKQYTLLGIITYEEGHAIPILLPMLVYWFKVTRKFYILFIVLLLLYILFSSTITTAFFLGLLVTAIAYLFNPRRSKIYNMVVIVGLVLIITLGNFAFTSGFLSFLKPYSSEMMSSKIDDVNLTLKGGEGNEVSNREQLYSLSWNSFIKHWIFGTWDSDKIGGHAFILDYLAYYGLLVFSFFLLFLYLQIKNPLKYINKFVRPYYYISLIPFVGLGFLKSVSTPTMYLFLFIILPGLAIYLSRLDEYSRKARPVIARRKIAEQQLRVVSES